MGSRWQIPSDGYNCVPQESLRYSLASRQSDHFRYYRREKIGGRRENRRRRNSFPHRARLPGKRGNSISTCVACDTRVCVALCEALTRIDLPSERSRAAINPRPCGSRDAQRLWRRRSWIIHWLNCYVNGVGDVEHVISRYWPVFRNDRAPAGGTGIS